MNDYYGYASEEDLMKYNPHLKNKCVVKDCGHEMGQHSHHGKGGSRHGCTIADCPCQQYIDPSTIKQ